MRLMSRPAAVVWSVVALLMLAPSSPGIQAQTPSTGWRMDGFSPERTNRSTVVGPQTNPTVEVIARDVIGGIKRSTANGWLITADVQLPCNGGTVTAYDSSGLLRWRIPVPCVKDVAIGPEGQVYIS